MDLASEAEASARWPASFEKLHAAAAQQASQEVSLQAGQEVHLKVTCDQRVMNVLRLAAAKMASE